jgi:hypothetical protein
LEKSAIYGTGYFPHQKSESANYREAQLGKVEQEEIMALPHKVDHERRRMITKGGF